MRYVSAAKLTHCYAERGHRRPGHASLVFVHGLSSSKDSWSHVIDVRSYDPLSLFYPRLHIKGGGVSKNWGSHTYIPVTYLLTYLLT